MECNVLISSAGRRVELLQRFRASLAALGVDGRIIATDAAQDAPAALLADAHETVPRVTADGYAERLLAIVEQYEIGLVVPTIDTELPVLAELAPTLGGRGAHVLVSGPDTIGIGADKARTHEWLLAEGLPCPRQWSASAAADEAAVLPYPVVVKPRAGSSSIGVHRVHDAAGLAARVSSGDVVQTVAPGQEYTVDVWVDRDGAVRSAVPRRRIEVRAGEVSKGVTERHDTVIDLALRTASRLPDAYGPLTVQVFGDDVGGQIIEINPRFGGGYPLSWEAGARTTAWAVQHALGLPAEPASFAWREGLTMLRYDQSVFVDAAELGR